MAKKQEVLPGKARGCYLIRSAVKVLSVEQIARMKRDIEKYPDMYPCPLERLWWIYKRECDACPHAVREER